MATSNAKKLERWAELKTQIATLKSEFETLDKELKENTPLGEYENKKFFIKRWDQNGQVDKAYMKKRFPFDKRPDLYMPVVNAKAVEETFDPTEHPDLFEYEPDKDALKRLPENDQRKVFKQSSYFKVSPKAEN